MQIALSALFMNDQVLPNTVTKRESSATPLLPALQHTDLPKLEKAEKSAIGAFYDAYGRAVATLIAKYHPELRMHYDQETRMVYTKIVAANYPEFKGKPEQQALMIELQLNQISQR
jgi:hypothetical protein